MLKSEEIRNKYLEFFRSREHKIVPSAPIVVKNDPTLMFTNAGMNQFKDIFLGNEKTGSNRIADTQKCLRVSGKHNDLEEVGHDTFHHTMFEMLGNWSFGDYFKKEAIQWAWELLTEEYGLDKNRLYPTIFMGDEEDKVPEDKEALEIWSQFVPEDRILKFGKKDNFWEMGETGPCGPCSEIHYDLRPEEERKKQDARDLVNKDHPLVVEIWNLVFMEFNRFSDKSLKNLPQKHVDTGMGFERLVMCLQNKFSSYETDIFSPLIGKLCSHFKVQYGKNEKTDIALRVISDHIRAITFAIADGQLPSNTGAGYVIRRILRRAVRYGFQHLNAQEPFLFELVDILSGQFENIFPEVKKQKDFIENVIREEEKSFLNTLSTGIKLFEKRISGSDSKIIPGDFAFELYDTFGFPLDLTRLMAREEGLAVDEEGFKIELDKQKNRSKKAAHKEESDWVEIFPVDRSVFVGYDETETSARIAKYKKVQEKNKSYYQVVLDKTPFYAESGGQVGDTGRLILDGETVKVFDTVRENTLFIHKTDRLPTDPAKPLKAVVDKEKRLLTANNHSATHLLHAALKQVLGPHVAQKGSLVNDKHLRFDFSHFQKVSDEEIRKIEDIVNQKIRANIPLGEERDVPVKEALDRGATALFGEKYGDKVRVITFDKDFSVELCGGTHVPATGQIGFFKIVSESAIAAGIRRIEAISAKEAENFVNGKIETLENIAVMVNNIQAPEKAISNLIEENKTLKKELEKLLREKASSLVDDLAKKATPLSGDYQLIIEEIEIDSPDNGKNVVFELTNKLKAPVALIGASFGNKANIWLMIPEGLISKGLNAGQLIREIAAEIKGGGGGQPHFASAGGSDPKGLKNALSKGRSLIMEKLQG